MFHLGNWYIHYVILTISGKFRFTLDIKNYYKPSNVFVKFWNLQNKIKQRT